eukprot:TRINITY_DN5325_c0_g1_i1.p1 TRINITY_DN5325_c0_g1~~TRINITY_DN5325_c0_g1_i1.p1  ORF type:complete len:290 (+),score=67.31 TRINITY_DN5325_c0_g1_i1:491-1360(+)
MMAPEAVGDDVFWLIIRGVEGYRVTLGDVVLPPSTRLRVTKLGPQKVTPYQLLSLANFTSDGALLTVVFSAESTDYTYLEACMRLVGSTGDVSFLSSGAEDYFLSASYFDEGMFKTENSGLTFYDGKGSLSAYKVHTRDFVPVQPGGSLVFRVGEQTQGCGDINTCPSQFCVRGTKAKPDKADTGVRMSNNITYTTMVLHYEWDTPTATDAPPFLSMLFKAVEGRYMTSETAIAINDKPEIEDQELKILKACGPPASPCLMIRKQNLQRRCCGGWWGLPFEGIDSSTTA